MTSSAALRIPTASLCLCLAGPSMADCGPSTNPEIVKEYRDAIEKADLVLDAFRKTGVPAPPALLRAMTRFNTAASVGVDIGHAAGQVDYEIEKTLADGHRLCASLDEDAAIVCEVNVETKLRMILALSAPGRIAIKTLRNYVADECDEAPGGIVVDVEPEGVEADLSDVRSKVLILK